MSSAVLWLFTVSIALITACGSDEGNKNQPSFGGTGGDASANGGSTGTSGNGGAGATASTGGNSGTNGTGASGGLDASVGGAAGSGARDAGSAANGGRDASGDGGPCDDGNLCTTDTLRSNGACLNVPIACQALDQCHTVGVCDPSTGVCSTPIKTNGSVCNDGDLCTQSDTCVDGVCTGGNPVVCTALDQCHEPGTCDPATGVCSNPNTADGTTCDDGNECLQTDTCQGGLCIGSNPIVCAAQDQCHDAGTCEPTTGVCSNPAKGNGAVCTDGDLCTQTDTCQDGACVGSNPINCSGSDECHAPGTCDPATGQCSNPTGADGTPCDDGNLCTQSSSCQGGVCTGSNPITCTPSDQCHDAGTCVPSTGLCTNPPKTSGATCNDGNQCTQTDTCDGQGSCIGATPVVCTAISQCHQAGVCNPSTGQCSTPPKTNGAACNDNNACTLVDVCDQGTCTGTNPVLCEALDQCHTAGQCDPATGQCTNPNKTNGATCSDSNLCTLLDTCQNGVCTGTSTVTCFAQDQCHDAGLCNPSTGQCSNPNKANGATCSDGNFCTQTDVCQNGACQGTNPITCTAVDQCHLAGTCDPGSGLCSTPNKTDGTACDDASLCSQTDTCQSGSCVGANPILCSAQDQCHTAGVCDPSTGVCNNPAKTEGAPCNDGSLCTQSDTCQAGACVGGNPVTCTALDQCHDPGTCNPQTGICDNPNKAEDAPCTDSNLCSLTQVCRSGVCTGTSFVTCTAQDQCHVAGTCDPGSGVCSNPNATNGVACDDNSLCTLDDSCQNGVCTGASTVTCTAVNDCHDAGQCDPATGACSTPQKTDGTACNDGNGCTQTDTCQAGTCTGGNPVTCSALDQCHNPGTCNPANGVCSNPNKANGTGCSDGSLCTMNDTCQSGTCTGGTSIVCTAVDQCHDAGTCNPDTGICSTPNKVDDSPCNDGLYCTGPGGTDVCTGGICGGAARQCDDGVVCTVDFCNEIKGACDTDKSACGCANDADCGADGNPCNGLETCNLVTFTCNPVTAPIDCSGLSNDCNIGVCVPADGTCTTAPRVNGFACDDNNLCTQSSSCQNGACTGANAITCVALGQCYDVGTCDPDTGVCSTPLKPNGAGCDDGDGCTQTDACASGVCTGSNPVVCTALDQCHEPGTCDPSSGDCSNPVSPQGKACNDGAACTAGDACNANGVCLPGPNPTNCADNNPCTSQECIEPAGCVYTNNSLPCDDNDPCTVGDVCGGGACNGNAPDICTIQGPINAACGDPCVQAVCAQDDFCCTVNWDDTCIKYTAIYCGTLECTCGDGECFEPYEDPNNCNSDCNCGNGICEDDYGWENGGNCPADCCGDNFCDPNYETSENCFQDCCGNGVCEDTKYENALNCADDCKCGNGTCEEMFENKATCVDDSCCNDEILPSNVPQTVFGVTTGMGNDSQPNCEYSFADDYLYSFQAPTTAIYSFDTFGSNFYTALSIRGGCGEGDMACNSFFYDPNFGYASYIQIALEEGQHVIIAVDAYYNYSGNYQLNINYAPPCGDGVCTTPGEGVYWNQYCPSDCAVCNDNICTNPPEDSTNCFNDCPICGDGACTTNEYVWNCEVDCAVCGDGNCSSSVENSNNCFQDCPICGDGQCTTNEYAWSCEQDCAVCGDGYCSTSMENSNTCFQDCPICGDGQCTQNEHNDCTLDCMCGDGRCDNWYEYTGNCPTDCGGTCGDGYCSPRLGEDYQGCQDCYCGDGICSGITLGEDTTTCPNDCWCGDRVCSPTTETAAGCPQDCNKYCGNGTCESSGGENAANCGDCTCGDGLCDSSETPAGCAQDCSCGDAACSATESPATCYDCSCGYNGVCDPAHESRATCYECRCGDGKCDPTEDSNNCPMDCYYIGSCAHSFCQVGVALAPGCDAYGYTKYLCDSWKPSCCTTAWDKECVEFFSWGWGMYCPNTNY